MIKHYFKIISRNLSKDKIFAVVNVLGLTIAILCCFLLVFWIKFELSYENCYTNTDRIYKLVEEEEKQGELRYNIFIQDCSEKLKETFPQIEAATYLTLMNTAVSTTEEADNRIMMRVGSSNPDFLRIFDFEFVEGSPHSVVKDNSVIITEDIAKKLFGTESPIGKQIYEYGGYTIGAVIKMPTNTQLTFDVLKLNSPYERSSPQYIMLRSGEMLTESLRKQIVDFPSSIKDTKSKFLIQPLREVHLHTPKAITLLQLFGTQESFGNFAQVLFFSFAVLLILLMAIINYVNTSVARSLSRIKEVGVRKVTGANKRQLIQRFLLESFMVTIIAVLIAIVFTKYLFPMFSEIMGNQIHLDFDWQTILLTIIIAVLISLLAGGYTSFYLSSFKPAMILRGHTKIGSKDGLRKGLLTVQFFISIAILIGTVFIYRQINAIFSESTGMDRENIIILDTSLWYQAEDFFKIIKAENPNIIDATIANAPPYNTPASFDKIKWDGKSPDLDEMSFGAVFCDHNYANTFGLEVIQGEFIPPKLTWWQWSEDKSYNIVINKSFADLMNVDNPIGITVDYGYAKGKIIGVVKDFNYKPLKEKIGPFFFMFNPEAFQNIYIKTTGRDKQKTLEYILAKYKEMKPDWVKRPVMYHTVADEYNEMYKDELRTLSILSVFTIITLLLSLMGIFSMVSFMIEKRSKEIAIRKINGAKILDIAKLFCKDVAKLGLIASLLAIPVCYILLSTWLDGYVYRTNLSWWLFLGIPCVLIGVVCILVSVQVWFTARKRPVESLRSE